MEYKVKFFDYQAQFKADEGEYMRIVRETFSKGSFILGEELKEFESNFAQFIGSRHAIGVGNCTAGLLLALYATGIGPGDEVITVSHTFVATVEVIRMLGAKPVLVDIAHDHNMDMDEVEAAITARTRAVIPVHLNGRVCEKMEKLMGIAEKNQLAIIEDAAQAIGASYKGRKAGTWGNAGCFSFYPAKLLGAFGDAGAIVTDDDDLAERLLCMRNHGRNGSGVELWGFNSRLDSVQAAILNYKLKKIKGWIERRREIANIYHKGLSGIEELVLPPPPGVIDDRYDVFQNYEVEAEGRDELVRHLLNNGIEVALPWGGRGVHQFPALGLGELRLPRTERLMERALLLPLYPELGDGQVEYVVESIQDFYNR